MTYFYGVYGGYNFINADSFHLAALAGYYFYKQDLRYTYGFPPFVAPPVNVSWNASSLMVGVKAAFNADPISVSLIYMYGVSNESTVESAGLGDATATDPAVLMVRVEGRICLQRRLERLSCLPRVQRGQLWPHSLPGPCTAGDIGATSIGAGVTYKF